MEYGRQLTEGSDAYLLGSILAVCASFVARRVYIDFGGPLYLNLFNLIVGPPGDRKSFTIKLPARIAHLLLPTERFLPPILSVEGLFDEYCPEEGGDPDQICIVDDAAIVLSTWHSSTYGERVADVMLRLYDCQGLSEAFRRNKKKKDGRVKRTVPETSTTLLFGATFVDALFSKQKSQQGLARRFLYYLSSVCDRFIKWPNSQSIEPIANLFKPLLAFKGQLHLATEADRLWEEFQHANRARHREVPENRPDLAHALASEPTHVLKIAALFELTTAVAHRQTTKDTIGPEALQIAIDHVAENLRASAYLFHRAQLLEAREKGEEILAKIRAQFPRSKKYPDTIFADKTRLTSTFCNNTSRHGALTTEELYLHILPALIHQAQAQLCLKKGRFELYAFRVSDLESGPSAPGNAEPISPISPPPRTNKEAPINVPPRTRITAHIVRERNNNMFIFGPGEIGEIANLCPRDVDLKTLNPLALDLETYAEVKVARRGAPKITTTRDALDPWKGAIRLVSLTEGADAVQSFDLGTDKTRALSAEVGILPAEVMALPAEVRTALECCPLIIHNACFDLLFLKVRLGIVPSAVFCTMTAARLLSPVRGVSHKLGPTVQRYLGIEMSKEHGGSDWGAFVLTDEQLAYAQDDVRHLHKLEATLRTQLEHTQLEKVFALEMLLIPIVVAMEAHGFAVDRAKLHEMRSAAAGKAAGLALALRTKFGLPTLNPESPSQLLEAFKSAGADIPDTDESTLSACADERAGLILAYREQAKLQKSIKGLLKAVARDGRIHARFSPTGSRTGRFSSTSPNLQNITRGQLRACFIPSGPERCLIVADYSQIELRIGAHLAGEEVMLKAFKARTDMHRATAAAVLSKALEEVTKADRQLAKAVNFGFLYGQGPEGFRQYARTQFGIVLSLEQATELRNSFFARYPGLAQWHQDAWQMAKDGVKEARTVLGRLLLEGDESRAWDRFQLQTSYRVSGSAADVIKLAMVKTVAMLPSDLQLVATVHDELVFDAPSEGSVFYSGLIGMLMEEAFTEVFGPELPIEVEVKVCANWAEK
jgi:DNA polymerase-1